MFGEIIHWAESFFISANDIVNVLLTPIDMGSIGTYTLLGFCTATGLGFYLAVAITKWILS